MFLLGMALTVRMIDQAFFSHVPLVSLRLKLPALHVSISRFP